MTTSEVDNELKERGIALRAAMSQMERILAYDYQGDVNNLVTWAATPSVASFTVDDLKPAGSAGAASAGALGSSVGQGTVAVDTTDPDRISVTVTVAWQGRRGSARTLTLPVTLSELAQ